MALTLIQEDIGRNDEDVTLQPGGIAALAPP
jgi:hypothetical protein